MMKRIFLTLFVIFAASTHTYDASAYDVVVEFSADAIQKAPGKPDYFAQMYISKEAVRTESTMNNAKVIEIINKANRTRSLLFTDKKVYLQQAMQVAEKNQATNPGANNTPCESMPNSTCKKLGSEIINGRKAIKWELAADQNGRVMRSLHWIDEQRQIPVKELFANGTITESVFVSVDTLNGRKTEQWSMKMISPDGHEVISKQWYDPELKMSIREELPGGYIRELTNIKVSRQKRKLFTIPADYKRVTHLPEIQGQGPR